MELDHELEDLPIYARLQDLLVNPCHCKLDINVSVATTNKMKAMPL
jgi:hypothetical protein